MAVVRIKRHLNEEPSEAVFIACKRLKSDTAEENNATASNFQSLFKFAGTVQGNKDSDVALQVSKSLKRDDFKKSLKHVVDISAKLRADIKNTSEKNRFKVVNCFRSLNPNELLETSNENSSGDGSTEDKPEESITILDVVPECENKSSSGNKVNEEYVYDLYYGNSDQIDDSLLEKYLSVYPINAEIMMNDYRGNDVEDEEEDSDDSNDENNWRNDYPDHDPEIDESISDDDDDMACRMKNMDLDDLSSDEDNFIHSYEAEPADIARFGVGYANYKRRVHLEMDSDDSIGNNSDDSLGNNSDNDSNYSGFG